MATNTGLGARVSGAVEATAGTEESRSVAMDITSWTVQSKAGVAIIDDLNEAGQTSSEAELVTTDVMGDVGFYLAYRKNLLGLWLMLAMGQVSTSGSGPYEHTFVAASALKTASLEAVRSALSAATELVTGTVCDKLVLEFTAGQMARGTASVMARSTGARGTATVPAAATSRTYINGSHIPHVTFNGTNYECRRVRVTIENFAEGLRDVGSTDVAEHIRSAKQKITVEVELTQRAGSLYTAYRARTIGALGFVATSSSSAKLEFASPYAVIEDQSDGITGVGAIVERVRFVCLADRATPAVPRFILTNGDSAYGAS